MKQEKTLIVESLDGDKLAEVSSLSKGSYGIEAPPGRVHELLTRLIADAETEPIPYLFGNRKVRTTRGQLSRSEGSFCRPSDDEFLDALADKLSKFEFYAYTEESIAP